MTEKCYCNLCVKGEDSLTYYTDLTDQCVNFLSIFINNVKETMYDGNNELQQKFVDVSKLVYYLNRENFEIGPQFVVTTNILVIWLRKHNPHIILHKEIVNDVIHYYILGYIPIYDEFSYERKYLHFEEYLCENLKECNVCDEIGFIKICKNDKCKFSTCMDCYSKLPRKINFSCPGCRTPYYMPEI
jgi:hypothetical protein